MSETIVVNFKNEPCDVKITRTPKGKIPEPPEFGCFGNPFKLEEFGREECIELFKDYFLKRVAGSCHKIYGNLGEHRELF